MERRKNDRPERETGDDGANNTPKSRTHKGWLNMEIINYRSPPSAVFRGGRGGGGARGGSARVGSTRGGGAHLHSHGHGDKSEALAGDDQAPPVSPEKSTANTSMPTPSKSVTPTATSGPGRERERDKDREQRGPVRDNGASSTPKLATSSEGPPSKRSTVEASGGGRKSTVTASSSADRHKDSSIGGTPVRNFYPP